MVDCLAVLVLGFGEPDGDDSGKMEVGNEMKHGSGRARWRILGSVFSFEPGSVATEYLTMSSTCYGRNNCPSHRVFLSRNRFSRVIGKTACKVYKWLKVESGM